MPCTTSKAFHTLCKPDCPKTGCACCVNTTFSCGDVLRCNELLINEKKPNVSALVCDLLTQLRDSDVDCIDILFEFIDDDSPINYTNLPEKHCLVRITVNNLTTQTTAIVDIEDREYVIVENNFGFDPGEIQYLVDGVECFRCTEPVQ